MCSVLHTAHPPPHTQTHRQRSKAAPSGAVWSSLEQPRPGKKLSLPRLGQCAPSPRTHHPAHPHGPPSRPIIGTAGCPHHTDTPPHRPELATSGHISAHPDHPRPCGLATRLYTCMRQRTSKARNQLLPRPTPAQVHTGTHQCAHTYINKATARLLPPPSPTDATHPTMATVARAHHAKPGIIHHLGPTPAYAPPQQPGPWMRSAQIRHKSGPKAAPKRSRPKERTRPRQTRTVRAEQAGHYRATHRRPGP